jgi:hypothetical protein
MIETEKYNYSLYKNLDILIEYFYLMVEAVVVEAVAVVVKVVEAVVVKAVVVVVREEVVEAEEEEVVVADLLSLTIRINTLDSTRSKK